MVGELYALPARALPSIPQMPGWYSRLLNRHWAEATDRDGVESGQYDILNDSVPQDNTSDPIWELWQDEGGEG